MGNGEKKEKPNGMISTLKKCFKPAVVPLVIQKDTRP
jgi:hypothetical protein